MSDLIERRKAIEAMGKAQWAKERLMELPSAQTEIIYCRDCKHFGTDKYKKLTWCGRKDYGYGWGKNDFCSRAEMRGNENVHP